MLDFTALKLEVGIHIKWCRPTCSFSAGQFTTLRVGQLAVPQIIYLHRCTRHIANTKTDLAQFTYSHICF